MNVEPLKETDCTNVLCVKMIVSADALRSSSAAAAHPELLTVSEAVTLPGVATVLSTSPMPSQVDELPATVDCLRVPVPDEGVVPVVSAVAKPATIQLLLSCVVRLMEGLPDEPVVVVVVPSAATPEY